MTSKRPPKRAAMVGLRVAPLRGGWRRDWEMVRDSRSPRLQKLVYGWLMVG